MISFSFSHTMKSFFLTLTLLAFASLALGQTLSLYCETGKESDGRQYVYIYGENLTNADQTVGALTFLLAHQQYQQWQAAPSWSLAGAKWQQAFSREEDIAQSTGFGSGFSHIFRCAQAAGPADDPLILPARTKMLLSRLAFTSSPLGEAVYLIGPQEDQRVAMADAEGENIPFSVTGQPVVAGLPVELLEFRAEQAGERLAEIRWTSQSESQTEKYVVEHSLDGEVFAAMTEVPAQGPSTYRVYDENPFLPVSYYRLRWLDIDGETGLSEIVQVRFADPEIKLEVFPNPSAGKVKIAFGQKLSVFTHLSLVNATGKTIWQRNALPESYEISADLGGFPAGTYWLRGLMKTGEHISTPLIMQP